MKIADLRCEGGNSAAMGGYRLVGGVIDVMGGMSMFCCGLIVSSNGPFVLLLNRGQ